MCTFHCKILSRCVSEEDYKNDISRLLSHLISQAYFYSYRDNLCEIESKLMLIECVRDAYFIVFIFAFVCHMLRFVIDNWHLICQISFVLKIFSATSFSSSCYIAWLMALYAGRVINFSLILFQALSKGFAFIFADIWQKFSLWRYQLQPCLYF